MMRDTIEDRIGAALRAEPGVPMCDGCLALQVKVSLTEAQAAVAALDTDPSFQVAQAECSTCRRQKVVVCALRHAEAR